jgi:hypothetical protein
MVVQIVDQMQEVRSSAGEEPKKGKVDRKRWLSDNDAEMLASRLIRRGISIH